jgi:hypothetical protein
MGFLAGYIVSSISTLDMNHGVGQSKLCPLNCAGAVPADEGLPAAAPDTVRTDACEPRR